jgi:hypothetical protein
MPDATSHHAALLAKLSDNEDYWLLFGALRVVLELHAPEFFGGFWACLACSPGMPPPLLVEWKDCATIKAIGAALGVDLNG